jgi:hypothetical protein
MYHYYHYYFHRQQHRRPPRGQRRALQSTQEDPALRPCEEAYGGEGSYDPERAARIIGLQPQLRVVVVSDDSLYDERESVLLLQWW